MKDFDPKHSFGSEAARHYDADSARGDEAETVAFLAELADGQEALEFAIGTGRIALPLRSTGVRVEGIELSQDMVDRLREKPGGAELDIIVDDMSRATTGRTYRLVYLVYNTIGNLLTQDDQVRCFENAARHLSDDGRFVLECRVPTAPSRTERQFVDVADVDAHGVHLEACRYDPMTQLLDEMHVHIGQDGIRLNPISLRLANPREFDLMARIAGLRLPDRWAGWNREPFTADSWRHVSVYQKAVNR